jgi:RNA polymerase sigma-70 factor, ECF subfamily
VRAALHLGTLTFQSASSLCKVEDGALCSASTTVPSSSVRNVVRIADRRVEGEDHPSGVSHRCPQPNASEEDARLVELARQGETKAFRMLYERYQLRAHKLAFGIVHDYEDAQDIVQEAFLRVHRGLSSFVGHSSFYTWLYRIVMNLSIDFARRIQYETRFLEAADMRLSEDCFLLQGLRRKSDPFEALERRELGRRLTAALGRLAPYHQGVLVMREVEGLSYQEMAVAMGVSKGTIMSRLFHARHNLRRVFGVHGEEGSQFRDHAQHLVANDSA